jgi:ABC-type uncharacterized transport system auxiliary subunit
MRSTILILLASAGGLATGSCVASRPSHFYTIEPPPVPASQNRPDGPVVIVGNVTTPQSLQDGRIRYRTGANEAGAYEYHRWTERPGTLVRNSLARTLQASGRYQRVLESSGSATGDYLVTGKLLEFGEVDRTNIEARISLHVELVDMKTGLDVWDHLTEREEPVNGKSVKDVVQALDRNLQQVVREMAGEIDRFLANRH